LFSFFIILPLLALSWSVYFLFSSLAAFLFFALDIHIWTKSIFNTLRLALMEISSPTCAPLTHTHNSFLFLIGLTNILFFPVFSLYSSSFLCGCACNWFQVTR
jgi:uncharacterized membrane protein YcgQ (UPF0703/DUF1980 family)